MEILILSIFILILGGLVSLVFKPNFKPKFCSGITILSGILALIPTLKVLISNNTYNISLFTSPVFGSVRLELDALSAIFVAIIAIMSSLAVIYANGYLKPYIQKGVDTSAHFLFLMLLIASMLAVVTVQNGLFFLIVWELMSLSSFFLVIFEGEKKEVLKSGIKYLVYMHLSVIFIISMFAILTNASNSFDFYNYIKVLSENPQLANLVFLLGFTGFGIKAGFVPFHNWLPDAHPAAPSHVSGLMSGVMIKTGIYGILRTLYFIGVPSKFVAYTVLTIAVISALYGIIYAVFQHDIKKLLAYSSIENIGVIGIGIGLGMLGIAYSNPIMAVFGFAGGILHILNHSIFKELLFFSAGSVYLKTHTKNIEILGGLIKKMPHTGLLFILGSIAICGLPPFNGFISEILIYASMLMGIPASEISLFIVLVISIASLALVGTVAILCFTKVAGITFLGSPRNEEIYNKISKDVSFSMLAPMSVLAFFAITIGLFPQVFVKIVLSPVSLFIPKNLFEQIIPALSSLMQIICTIFTSFVVLLGIILLIRKFINKKSETHNTWGCGYDNANSKMQYTASSYSNLLASTLAPLFKRVSHIKKPKELFPKEAYYEVEIEDIEEAYIVEPIVKMDEKILTKFERIQNGNMQQYILFGLIFLVISIIGLIVIG